MCVVTEIHSRIFGTGTTVVWVAGKEREASVPEAALEDASYLPPYCVIPHSNCAYFTTYNRYFDSEGVRHSF